MSLLTPSESLAFQSFLSSIDYSDALLAAPQEWAMYSAGDMHSRDDVHIPHAQGKEALAKATKDLMSLDTGHPDRWSQPSLQPQLPSRPTFQQSHSLPPTQPTSSHNQVFPFLKLPSHSQPQLHSVYSRSPPLSHPQSQLRPPPSISPLHTVGQQSTPSYSSPSLDTPLSAPPSFPSSRPSPPRSHSSKRPVPQESHSQSSNKRPRPSPSASSSSTGSTSTLKQPVTAKQTLLSPSQKKANHIQSEQKRRANIRRGYEALCETVPALREAILQEEREQAQEYASNGGTSGNGGGNSKKKKGRKASGEEGERIDGRAGPRSENVVLQKTIDYITDLLSERTALLTRLHSARVALPPQQRQHYQQTTDALWEREWTGGAGVGDEDDDEADGDEVEE